MNLYNNEISQLKTYFVLISGEITKIQNKINEIGPKMILKMEKINGIEIERKSSLESHISYLKTKPSLKNTRRTTSSNKFIIPKI